MDTKIDLDELERLAAQATPGPWKQKGNFIFCAANMRLAYVEAERALDLQTASYITAACDAVPGLIRRVREQEERIAELVAETSRQKRVIHMLENRVLEFKGMPIPMAPRLPTCDALVHPRHPLQSNRSNAKEEEK